MQIMFPFWQIYCGRGFEDLDRSHKNVDCETTVFIETMISLSNLLVCVNSSGNFLLYMLRGKKFRDAFCQTYFRLFCKCCRKKYRNGESPIVSSSIANHQTFGVRRPISHPLQSLGINRAAQSYESNSTSIFNGTDRRNNLSGSRHLMAVRNESEANYTTTSFVEGDILLTVHLAGEGSRSICPSQVGNQLWTRKHNCFIFVPSSYTWINFFSSVAFWS
jgi:hypothetical protein